MFPIPGGEAVKEKYLHIGFAVPISEYDVSSLPAGSSCKTLNAEKPCSFTEPDTASALTDHEGQGHQDLGMTIRCKTIAKVKC